MTRLLLALLLATAVACADRQATQYVGTVMRESAPDSAGSLRLTLYTHDDTGFTGVIELGAPARGTGTAYAWHEGSELHVATVGAQTGDTIHWTSLLTDEGLGGRFEVTGGDRTGQRGTWRARLVQGLPATPATLRRPTTLPMPRVLAFWPLLVFVGAGAWLARWIRAAPRPPTVDGGRWRAPQSRLAGIGGWLAFFVFVQSVSLLAWFARADSIEGDWRNGMGFGAAAAGMQELLVVETAMQVIGLPLTILGLVLLLRRSHFAPRYWFAAMGATLAYSIVDATFTPMVHAQTSRLLGAEVLAGATGSTLRDLLRQGLANAAWMLYWLKSERVRATFGAAALDRSFVAPVGLPAEATDVVAARPGRSWRRVALWTVAAVVLVVVTTAGLAFLAMRATPFEVPQGKDIRDVVSGRWTWESDSLGCRNAHTIAFADSGKVMTITSSTISDPDPITTYDIQVLSRSTIRGAIRGETRKTDDGKPLVWELVLTGPGEYRWRRTDWLATPWSYTGAIRRCPHAQPAPGTSTR